ncbi:ferritin [Candidatus Regiella insecticola]|uniref:Ferritin n=1 Tax=Candidatus Regiella insecticola TaxID=138073 RepID=A0A6L2ZP94_9ENTR|nr:ferritin [Candidatus Regiella insecticola]GFN46224.1 ferritin [Candidatus Regiella insecticola]
MLQDKIKELLTEQLNLEFSSANLYLQMSAWCCRQGFDGAASFLKAHFQEEIQHMQRLVDYLNDHDVSFTIKDITVAPVESKSLAEIFEQAYQHECCNTKKINELVWIAMDLKDASTFHFLQWYVAEQREEEKLFKSILDKFKLIGESSGDLLLVDQNPKTYVKPS